MRHCCYSHLAWSHCKADTSGFHCHTLTIRILVGLADMQMGGVYQHANQRSARGGAWLASFYFLLHDEPQATIEVLRPPTRLCTMQEQTVKKLANSTICPVVALSILDAKSMHAAGKRTDPQRFAHLLRTNQLAMAYVVHDKRSRSMPRLASAVKREIADAVNAIGVSLQAYEVQPLLDACRRNYRAQKWDPLVSTHYVKLTHSLARLLARSLTYALTHSSIHPSILSLVPCHPLGSGMCSPE